LEIIYELIKDLLRNDHFVKEKLYNFVNKKNMEQLILNNRKKMKRLKKILVLQTDSEEIIEEKIIKN
jgi:hypothetical protein